jgi:hypothetical protein
MEKLITLDDNKRIVWTFDKLTKIRTGFSIKLDKERDLEL